VCLWDFLSAIPICSLLFSLCCRVFFKKPDCVDGADDGDEGEDCGVEEFCENGVSAERQEVLDERFHGFVPCKPHHKSKGGRYIRDYPLADLLFNFLFFSFKFNHVFYVSINLGSGHALSGYLCLALHSFPSLEKCI